MGGSKKMKKLIVNGCSYAAGNELALPEISAWPVLLANKLGRSLTNLAESASSNKRIFRTTLEYCSELDNTSDYFFIIGWSQPTRIEFYLDRYDRYYQATPTNLNMYETFPEANAVARNHFQYQAGTLGDGMNTMENIIALQSLFKARGIRYLMFNTFAPKYVLNTFPRHFRDEPKEFRTDYKVWSKKLKMVPSQLLHMIDEKNFIKPSESGFSMNTYLRALNVPYAVFHPLEEGHSMWSYYLDDFINSQNT